MINVYNIERSLEIQWLKGINSDWQTLLYYDIKGLKWLLILGGGGGGSGVI